MYMYEILDSCKVQVYISQDRKMKLHVCKSQA